MSDARVIEEPATLTRSDRAAAWLRSGYIPHHPAFVTVPVVVATALAERAGEANLARAAASAVAGMAFEVGGRFINYHQDLSTGVDDTDALPRTHPLVTQTPSVRAMAIAGWTLLVLSGVLYSVLGALISPVLIAIGPVVVLGTHHYAGGRRYGHRTLGEVGRFVAIAQMTYGNYFLQTESISASSVVCSFALGSFAVAGMSIQNDRDRETDARAGKTTLAVRLGARGTRRLIATLLTLPYLLLVPIALLEETGWVALALLSLPWAVWIVRTVTRPGRDDWQWYLHPRFTLPGMIAYGLLLSVGLLV
jgi:1,4-dihydroxy-2-naphthoate octaprenyltransferase